MQCKEVVYSIKEGGEQINAGRNAIAIAIMIGCGKDFRRKCKGAYLMPQINKC